MKNWQKFAAGGAVVVVALAGTRADKNGTP